MGQVAPSAAFRKLRIVVPGATRSLTFMNKMKAWLTPAWYFSARVLNHAGVAGVLGLVSIAHSLLQVGGHVNALLVHFLRIFGAVGRDLADVEQRHLLAQGGEQGFDGRLAAGEGATL